jgi:transposase
MDDLSDDPTPQSPRRIEVYAGNGRRRWPDEVKAQIVAESLVPGSVVTHVARRHGCRPQQVWDWRRMARRGELVLPMGDAPLLVPLVTAEPPTSDGGEGGVVVEIREARVHVNGRPGVLALTDVFAALRKAHTC